MNEQTSKPEKQRYEKPRMVTEKVDVATFVGLGSGLSGGHERQSFNPVIIHASWWGICCR
jgi:hypothetical protein